MLKLTSKFSTQFVRRAIGALVLSLGAMHAVQSQDAPARARDADALASVLLPQPAVQPGQSATQLPDGRWLLLGGEGPGKAPLADATIVQVDGGATPLHLRLNKARSGHTATLLPDGTVLVLGGVDAAGAVVAGAEQLDLAGNKVQDLGDLGLIARTGHTATVLANSQLLISGGFDQHDHAVYEAELFNLATRKVERFNAKLDIARTNHVAALLPGSDVLLWGGTGNDRRPIVGGELYQFDRQQFDPLNPGQAAALGKLLEPGNAPAVKSTQPAAGAGSVPLDRPLVVSFTQRMMAASLSTETVTLIGPQGALPIRVVPVEYGLLLFVTPTQDLLPASSYTLFIKGAMNVAGQPLPFTAIGFQTARLSGQGTPVAAAFGAAPADAPPLSADGVPARPASEAVAPNAKANAEEQKLIDAADSVKGPETWLPDATSFKGDWRARRAAAALQGLPPLRAADGETALAGQVLTLHGKALPNVTLTVGSQSTTTDATGRFLLTQLAPGDQVLSIDGEGAGKGGAHYGFYQVKVTIAARATNILDYTIWSSLLDPAGNMALPSPTSKETVLTSPRIPGLELHLPAGTIIRDRNGKIVTALNMTAIPTDRPPFPIPRLAVPVYFTIQPGGARISNSDSSAPQGARLIYPNFSGAKPGTRISFWNYDPRGKGWYIYGKGMVSQNGKQVNPDPGVVIYEFTGAMVSIPDNAPDEGPPPDGCQGGDPVDCFTGLFLQDSIDMAIQDVIPLEVRRTYRPRDPASRAFGVGTNLSYDFFMIGDIWPYTYQELILPDGGRVHYNRISAGTSYGDAVYQNTSGGARYFGSTVRYVGGSWELKLKDGTAFTFPDAEGNSVPRYAAVRAIRDRFGNALILDRDNAGNLTRITSPGGRYLEFTYDASARVTQAKDNIGRTSSYEYDEASRLVKATDPLGQFEAYTYDANNNMLTVRDKRGNMKVTNEYDINDRVSKQTYADGTTNLFAYALDANNKVTQTDLTDERGIVTRMVFNAGGYPTSVTKALGLPEQQVVTFERNPATNLLISQTDALGRKTAYTYDSKGNMLSGTVLAGTANALTATMTYTADFNQLASVTDFQGRQSTMAYDSLGNLTQLTDPNGNHVNRSYNGAGQLTRLTDPLGRSVNFDYFGFDLAQVTDPSSRSVSMFTDSVGRVRSMTDPLGNRTSFEFDPLDRATKVIDPLNQVIEKAYDGGDNLTRVTDPKGNQYQFAFDPRQAPVTSTDPLNQSEAFVYDGKHNVVQKTDRKGQVTQYAYDALNRLTTKAYADGSAIVISYDQANRPTQFADSANGTITVSYDNRDQVTQVITPKGSVAYTYQANGLRQSMTVFGQPALTYTYDPADRLTRIDQAAGAANNNVPQSISFTYDAAGRRLRTSFMNGMTRDNGYDNAGQLTTVTYANADGSVLGDLAYTYDNGGRRIATGGSLAHAALPEALADAAVDAANRLTAAGTQTLTYDANGNLIGDGSRQYVWNARDQLVQIQDSAGAVIAAFTYDAFGRRQTKTIDGVANGYVYDGSNIVQELAGAASTNNDPGNVKASYVGGALDEVFAQFSGTGENAAILTYLTDALGSTIRLVDAAGAKVVEYTYDPYGNTIADAAVSNPFQYTGRENDGTGLYYYRARYYSPNLGRFISSDPLGLDGGINTYTYVSGNPLSLVDPYGLLGVADLPTVPQGVVDFAAGFGDTLSFGLTNMLRDAMGTNGNVNQCSASYTGGVVAGAALSVAIGGAAGLEAAGAKGAGKEFSHWIPNRMGGPRSVWNGNYVSTAEHALSDPYRYRFMPRAWKEANPMPNQAAQQWERIPNVYKGGAAGAAAGAAGAANSGCGCK